MSEINPFDFPVAANDIAEDKESTFTCIKCKNVIEYGEFFKHDDPTFDFGFYILDSKVSAVGVEIVKGIDLCKYCVPKMY